MVGIFAVGTSHSNRIRDGKVRPDRGLLQWRRQGIFPYILLLPAIFVVTLFIIYPVCQAVVMSFYNITLTGAGRNRFVGLFNYRSMLVSREFWGALWVTLLYVIGSVMGAYLIGLATALLISMPILGRKLIRLCLILPWALPQVVVAMIWMLMYDYQYGIVNYLLQSLHVIDRNINWLGDPSRVVPLMAILAPSIWNQYPVATLMLLAGLLMIPADLYEAAAIDGANPLQKFRYVTWPGLRPVTNVLILLFTIWAFKRFDLIYLMTQGGPLQATETIIIQTYLQAFQFWNMGYAASIGTFSLVVSLAFSTGYLLVTRRKGEGALE